MRLLVVAILVTGCVAPSAIPKQKPKGADARPLGALDRYLKSQAGILEMQKFGKASNSKPVKGKLVPLKASKPIRKISRRNPPAKKPIRSSGSSFQNETIRRTKGKSNATWDDVILGGGLFM